MGDYDFRTAANHHREMWIFQNDRGRIEQLVNEEQAKEVAEQMAKDFRTDIRYWSESNPWKPFNAKYKR